MPNNPPAPRRGRLRCFTRAVKNARFLQQHDPATFAKDPSAEGFGTGVPADILQRLHYLKPDSAELRRHKQVAEFLRKNPMPKLKGGSDER